MYTTSANKKQRSSRVNTASTSRPTAPTDEPNSDDENRIEANLAKTQPNKLRKKIQLQMAGYALEMLSSGLFRSHTIGMLVDTQQIQLGYYDHSSILLSAPFSIDTDEIHFLETLYHLRALSLSGRGVVSRLKLPKGDPDDLVSPGLKPTTTLYADAQVYFGSQLLILGNVLYRARSIVGRGTIVIEAAPKEQPDAWLYTAKYSFPPATRHSEASLILSALRTAKQRPEWSWVENHLPNLKFWEDVELTDDDDDEDFPHERIKLFLDEHCPDFGYEKRVLRILVQDRLEPLTSLSEEVHYAQVFCDVLQAHRWLYDHCQILHRDISMNNIMVRKVDGKIFGVLNDLDLASRATKEMSATSKHRTGTRPFMAYELLDPKKVVSHLYRHDLESFFYVMLCLCCRYNLDGTRAGNEYDEWFTRSALDVKRSKTDMFTQLEAFEPPVTPDFSAFEPLLVHIHGLIKEALVQGLVSGIQGTPFDPETGNNRLTYENFLDNLKTFDNENFTIHYLSPSPLPAQPVDESVLEEDQREMRAKMGKWLDEDSYLADSKPSGKARKGKARNA
ncbi:hypothetical protein K435DRAFT_771032 [Dendrothele bispora CBS 962.96]|uniref:Protein kinase domain-containing protein n=1 Tax=Dendrothele bispora (strain CBS 962.96) TaxID=1314807 RepID=A0A4S8KLL4_DENBC|nr:hypothetical protein K435DRAFT_771032 [Dendrothele bispora CBS 962.96]